MLRFAIRPALLVTLGALALGACGIRGPLEVPRRTAEETSTTTTAAAPAANTTRSGVTWNTPTGLSGQGSQEQVVDSQQNAGILQAGSGGPNDPFRVDRAPGATVAPTRPRAAAPRSTIFNGFVLDPLL